MTAREMRSVCKLIYNENIDIISKIYREKVDINTYSWLLDKKNELQKRLSNNTSVWINFVLELDEDNLQILTAYVNNYIKKTPHYA